MNMDSPTDTSIFPRGFDQLAGKLALVYLSVPSLLFVTTWLKPPLGLAVAGLFFYLLHPSGFSLRTKCPGGGRSGSQIALLAFAALMALGFAVLSFPSQDAVPFRDAAKHGIILNDLVRESWPVVYLADDTSSTVLRYALGYYLVPAGIAKIVGVEWASHLLAAWTALGVFLFYLMIASHAKSIGLALVQIVIATLFSGLDLLYVLWALGPGPEIWGVLFDPWSRKIGNGLLIGSHPFELRWSPQHALAAWLAAGLLYRSHDEEWFRKSAALAAVSLMFWSPFVAVTFAFLLTVLWVSKRNSAVLRDLFSARTVVASALGLLTLYFLTYGAGAVPTHLFEVKDPGKTSLYMHFIFVVLEFGLLALALRLVCGSFPTIVQGSILLLLILPLTYVGLANDLQMRGSQLPITLLMFASLGALAIDASNAKKGLLVGILIIGAVAGAQELFRPKPGFDIAKDGWNEPLFMVNWGGNHALIQPQYLARVDKSSALFKLFAFANPAYEPGDTVKLENRRLAAQDYPSVQPGSTLSAAGTSSAMRALLVSGWSNPESWGVWSDGTQARLGLTIDGDVDTDVEISLMLKAFLTAAKNELTVVAVANGRSFAPFVIRGDQTKPARHTIRVPREDVIDAYGRIQLDFDIEDPRSPKELGLSEDARKLGIGLVEMSVREVKPGE